MASQVEVTGSASSMVPVEEDSDGALRRCKGEGQETNVVPLYQVDK